MATQNNENASENRKQDNNTLKTLGALGGIVLLLVLLFVGVSQSKPAGAELITDGSKPDKATYQEDASVIDFEKAILKEYDNGKMIELQGRIHKQFEEPQKGEATTLLNLPQDSGNNAASTKTNQVILTFLESPAKKLEEHVQIHVYGRYIGTLEYETSVGTMKEVPAIQVDYLELQS